MTLRQAIEEIRRIPAGDSLLHVRAISRFFRTPCVPAGAGPDYVNAALLLTGADNPADLLKILHDIEARFGRERKQRWGNRTLDLDLLGWGDVVLPDIDTFRRWQTLPFQAQRQERPESLILPHPRLAERGFVLIPLLDIAPDWMHPVLDKTVQEMVDALPPSERSAIKPL